MPATINKYDIAERVMFAGLDGFDGRMSANQQREVFGRAIFGRKRITISCDGQGEVEASWSAAFGTDRAGAAFSFAEVADYANHPDQAVRF